MPWINLTVRRGTFTKQVRHAVMAKLTDALMVWEKIPDTPEARKKMKGWVYQVDEDSDYNGGSPHHKDPSYFIEVRLPAARFDTLTKQHLILVVKAFGDSAARVLHCTERRNISRRETR
jgi:hypothetical protein